MDQHAVADLLRQPQQGAFIQLAVLGVGRPVQPGLLRRLLIQLLAVAAGRHIRRRVPPGKPQPAPQVVPGAPLLLDGAQLLWGIHAPPEAPLDIRPVRLRPLVGAQHGPQRVRRPDKPRLSGMGRPADSQIVGAHQLCWRYLGHKCDPPPVVEVQPQLRLGPHPSVKAQILPEARPNVLLQLLWADVPAAQCPVQSLVPGRHQPCGLPQHAFPPGRLHRVYQLIPRHPLLPGGLVFHGEELPGMGLPQLLQCGPLGQLLFIRRIFQGQPRQIVHHRLPHIPQPRVKQPPGHFLAEPLVYQADDEIHVKIRCSVGFHGQKFRFKAIRPRRGPDQIHRPPLLGAVSLHAHNAQSVKSLDRSSFAGIRPAMTSRIRSCS